MKIALLLKRQLFFSSFSDTRIVESGPKLCYSSISKRFQGTRSFKNSGRPSSATLRCSHGMERAPTDDVTRAAPPGARKNVNFNVAPLKSLHSPCYQYLSNERASLASFATALHGHGYAPHDQHWIDTLLGISYWYAKRHYLCTCTLGNLKTLKCSRISTTLFRIHGGPNMIFDASDALQYTD